MAVYERSYKDYRGVHTPEWSRFLVLPRYAYQQVFASKAFIVYLVLCSLYPLFCAAAIYAPHNLNFLKLFQIDPQILVDWVLQFLFPVRFMKIQGFLAFLMVFFVGPALISADMRNNALPLYLSRPFTRTEYVVGKLSVLVILLSAITWIPGLLLFLFQAYMLGWGWFLDNLRMAAGLFFGSWIMILVLSLLALAISAYVKWKPVARIALIVVLFAMPPFGLMINGLLDVSWGRMLILVDMFTVLQHAIFGTEPMFEFPVTGALLSLGVACALCIGALARKVKAYEVVRT